MRAARETHHRPAVAQDDGFAGAAGVHVGRPQLGVAGQRYPALGVHGPRLVELRTAGCDVERQRSRPRAQVICGLARERAVTNGTRAELFAVQHPVAPWCERRRHIRHGLRERQRTRPHSRDQHANDARHSVHDDPPCRWWPHLCTTAPLVAIRCEPALVTCRSRRRHDVARRNARPRPKPARPNPRRATSAMRSC